MSRLLSSWRRLVSGAFVAGGLVLSSLPFTGVSHADPFLVPVGPAVPFNQPIGIDYHQPTNSVVFSVNYPSGNPHNFELIDQAGTATTFSTIQGLTDEVYIGAVRTSHNGFIAGQLYTGNGTAGQITRISPDGSTIDNPWTTLNDGVHSEGGLLRGALHFDETGTFGGDLIVATDHGNVWRVNSSGTPTFVANVGGSITLEGLTTVPNTPLYGPWAGTIVVGSETTGLVYSITPAGTVTSYNLGGGVDTPENVSIVPAGQNWYGVDYAEGKILSAPADRWTTMIGDLALGTESGKLFDVKWDATQSKFVPTLLATAPQWEGATFAPAGLGDVPGVPPGSATPEAPSSVLFGAGAALFFLGMGVRSRRRKVHSKA